MKPVRLKHNVYDVDGRIWTAGRYLAGETFLVNGGTEARVKLYYWDHVFAVTVRTEDIEEVA